MKPFLVILVFAPFIIGCGKPDQKLVPKSVAQTVTISEQNQRSLFPFAEGNSWIYLLEIVRQSPNQPRQSTNEEIEYKVTKVVKESDDMVRATISVIQNGKVMDVQGWSCDKNGIFQNSMKPQPVAYSPKQPVILFPAKTIGEFNWEGSGLTPIGKPGTMKYKYKNDGIQQNVDTEQGSMSALFMQTEGSFKTSDGIDGKLIVNSWFTPGVGLIRFRQVVQVKTVTSSITLRLKSYNVKK